MVKNEFVEEEVSVVAKTGGLEADLESTTLAE
jgi:hypothetical protein